MTEPSGAEQLKLSSQGVLSVVYDEAQRALRSYLIAGVTIDPGEIKIGAVMLEDYDTEDRVRVDAEHYLFTRSILRLYNGGSPVDVSESDPVPTKASVPSSLFAGSAVDGAALPSIPVSSGVSLSASLDNVGPIFILGSYPLNPGAAIALSIDDLSKVTWTGTGTLFYLGG